MIENSIMDFIICALLGFITWFFGGINELLQVLIAFSVIDYVTGIVAAGLNHELSSRVGFRGIMRKIEMFMFVGMAHLLDSYFPGDAGNIRTFVCLFYVVNEGISIIENAEKIGVPIPKPLHNMLAKLHDMTQAGGEFSKPESNMTESGGESANPDDNCKKMTVYNTYGHSEQELAPPDKVKESKHDKAK